MDKPASPAEFSERYSFKDKTAVVTGGGTGIGQASTWALLAAGARRVIVTGRRADKLAETARAASEYGYENKVLCCAADVAVPSGRDQVLAMVEKLGSLDLLVNNAGVFVYQSIDECSDQAFEDIFSINAKAPFAMMRNLLPWLVKSRGSVVNISSSLAQKPIANTSLYNGSKAAVIQMTKTLALELGPKGVRVNAILPAVVATPMYRDRFADENEYRQTLDGMATEHPLGRVGVPDDIAQAIVFLASPAASWITGAALPVDGGMLCT